MYAFSWSGCPNAADLFGRQAVQTKTPVCPCAQEVVDKEGSAMARQTELMMRHFDGQKTQYRLPPGQPKPGHCAIKVEPIVGPPNTYPVIVTPVDPIGAPIPQQPSTIMR